MNKLKGHDMTRITTINIIANQSNMAETLYPHVSLFEVVGIQLTLETKLQEGFRKLGPFFILCSISLTGKTVDL